METTFISNSKKAVPHSLQSSAKKKLKVQDTKLLVRQRGCRKGLSFNEYLGFACYHTTWQNVAPTIKNNRKENFKRSGIKTRSTKNR